jgi:hypothetical protein
MPSIGEGEWEEDPMADLKLDVFVGGDNAFNVTSTIVSGERDVVVVDGSPGPARSDLPRRSRPRART